MANTTWFSSQYGTAELLFLTHCSDLFLPNCKKIENKNILVKHSHKVSFEEYDLLLINQHSQTTFFLSKTGHSLETEALHNKGLIWLSSSIIIWHAKRLCSAISILIIITCASSEARHKFRFCFILCRGLQPLDVILDILDSDWEAKSCVYSQNSIKLKAFTFYPWAGTSIRS